MNEELKRRLYNLEVHPPGKTWDKIRAALNDEVAAEFPSQLYELELQPPSKTWNSIATTLSYSEKLYNLELQPPVTSWQNIATALDEDKPIRRIAPVRRIAVWKYAVAASLLAMVGFGVKFLTAERTGPEVANQTPQTQKITDTRSKAPDNQLNTQATVSTDVQNAENKKPSNNLPKEGPREAVPAIARARPNYKRPGNFVAAVHKIPKSTFASSDAFCMTSLKTNAPGFEPRIPESAYRYLLFENDNCDLVRMSKKLAEKLGCNAPNPNTPEYQNCIQQLKKWSEKIAQMNINPSPDNFMNIFELLKSTEDKQF